MHPRKPPGTSNGLAGLVPVIGWVTSYRREFLRSDLTAGLTVAVLLIPQSMAYAALAGMPAQAGLYAAIVSLIVYAILGTSRVISVAPVAIDSLLVAAAVGPIAQGDTTVYVSAAGLLAVMSGVMQLALGVLRLGALVNFLSMPVISGFISAASITIAASQLKELLGVTADGGSTFGGTIAATWTALGTVSGTTVVIGSAAIAALVLARRFAPQLPAALLVVAGATVLVALFRLDQHGVRVLGSVPSGLPTPQLPAADLDLLAQLLPAAATIAVISYLESITTAKAFAARTRQRIVPNQELLALGAANMAAGLFRGFAVAGGFSRGAVNFRAGAKTQLSGVVAAAVLALAVAFLTPLFFYLPRAALAAVIVVAVASLVDVRGSLRMFQINRVDGVALLVTFLATLSLGVALGLAIGVAVSLVIFIARTARPQVAEIGRVKGTVRYRNVDRWETHTDNRIAILRMDAPLYFANAKFFEDRVQNLVASRESITHLVLVASAIGDIDVSGVQQLSDIDDDLAAAGIELHLVTVRGPVRDVLRRAGRWDGLVAAGRVHTTIQAAVEALAGTAGTPLLPSADDQETPPKGLA